MIDLNHNIGSDLSVSPSGDIAISTGTATGQQRVLRRLLTNPLEYIWHTDYGAGLGGMVGMPANGPLIINTIRAQLSKEAAVLQNPLPSVSLQSTPDGTVSAHIQYADADTSDNQVISLPVGSH